MKRMITQYLYDRATLNIPREGEDEANYLHSILEGLNAATEDVRACLQKHSKAFFLDGLNRNIENPDYLVSIYNRYNQNEWAEGFLKVYKLLITQDFFYAGLMYGNLLRNTVFQVEKALESGNARRYYNAIWSSASADHFKNRFMLFAAGFLGEFDIKPPFISVDCFDNERAFQYFKYLQTEYFYTKALSEKNKEDTDMLKPIYKVLQSNLERNLYCFYESDQYKDAVRELTRRNIDILPLIFRASQRDPEVWTTLTKPAYDCLKDGRFYEAGQAIAARTKDVLPKLAIGPKHEDL